ncbi:hypothetical protein KJ815_11920, partial [bacterium]|nr:hypothetical protein [bacterium]
MHRVLTALAVTIAFVASAATSTSAASERSLGNVAVNVLRSDLSGADLRLQPPPNDARSSENSPLDETTSIWSSGGILWAVPTGTDCVIVTTTAIGWRSVAREEIPDSVWESTLADPLPLVRVSSVMILREMPLISLAFNPLQPTEDGSTLRRCEDVAVELHYSGAARSPDTRRLSAEFYALARPMVENLDEVSPEPEAKPESYLIITNPTYTTQLTTFVNWKRARGHTVTVRTTAQTGSTNQQIRTFLQTAYNTWAEPPVYVLLVGDVDNPSPLASWLVPGSYHPLIASDHPYALLDGEDYLPDVFVGRFSIDQGSEAQTVVNKCIAYERDPHQPQGDWRRRMMIVGVRSTPGYYQTYNSAWPTLQWIGRQFTEVAGYNQICTVPFPGSSSGTISQWINSGVSFVAYRGFGSPSDWTYPSYTVSDVQTLSNGAMLPVVASIVCGGGAFESTVDPCFGEAWLRAGSPSQPKGAIGFIGPSELDTKTRWNNTIVAGIYEGILFEDVPTLSAAMLRGKLELIRQFPNNVDVMEADADRSVSFYFHCYNLLGDPGLTFYVGDVRSLSATLPPSLPLGAPSLTLTINHASGPLAGAWGTVVRSDTAFSRAVSDSNGRLTLRLPQDVGGPLQVTVTKPRFATVQSALTLGTATSSVGSHSTTLCDDGHCGSNGNGDGRANPGEALSLGMVVRNYGTASFGGGWLNLAAVSGPLTVITSQQSLPVLSPQAQSDTLWFVVPVIPGANDGTIGRLEWSVTPGGFVWQTETEIYAPRLLASAVRTNGIEGNPPPLSSPEVSIQLANHGRTEQPAFTATLRSQEGRVIVLDSIAQYAAIPAGASTWPVAGGFTIAVGSFYPGDRANTVISSASPSRTEPISFALPIGNLTGDDPTHPDDYGYRAFQSGDTAYSEAPPYAWVEIRPSLGGSGTILSLPDTDDGRDTTRTISLPFGFRFYGHLYQQISVCSNGFIAFGPTTESYFRNYALPAIASPDKMVCVFWDDLMVPPTGAICTYHDANSGRFIIEWSGLRNQYGLGQPESFQLMLFDTACWATRTGDGELLMQYKEFSNVDAWDNYSTVGIQDRDLGHALQITYAGHNEPGVSTIRSQQSILFTTGRPDSLAYLS